VLDQHRSTQRKVPGAADDEAALTAAIIDWARQYGRYGYRRVTALLRAEGWQVNHKRVERIWRREGLKVPVRRSKRGRLWLNDGSCVQLRPERANHVWAYDFVEDPAANPPGFGEDAGRAQDPPAERCGRVHPRVLVDPGGTQAGFGRRHRRVGRPSRKPLRGFGEFIARGTPGYIRSDNGPEFIATAVKGWISGVGARTAFIEPGSPWENGYVESFNGKLRDELLNAEAFNTLLEARVLIEQWRVHYNRVRPHSSLGYRPPAPEVVVSGLPILPPARPGPTGSHQPPVTMLH